MQDHRRKLQFVRQSLPSGRESLLPLPFSWLQWTIHPSASELKNPPDSDKTDAFPCKFSQGVTPAEYNYLFLSFFKQKLFSHGLVPYQCQTTPDASTGPPVGAHG